MKSVDPMIVAFRTTCSREIGFGHLRRCLTLAAALRERGLEARFLVDGDEVAARLAGDAGFSLVLMPDRDEPGPTLRFLDETRASALVVDDYAITAQAIAALSRQTFTLVVDDLADRALEADLILNGSPGAVADLYPGWPSRRLLLGPRHALLRLAFRGLAGRTAPPEVRRVLVTLGGSDPQELTTPVVQQVLAALPASRVDVVVGPFARPSLVESDRVEVHVALSELLPLMMQADLAVTAGGQTAYETAACGLPSVALRTADNQRENLAALTAAPTLIVAPEVSAVGAALAELAADRATRQKMADAGQTLFDGRGAERVAAALEEGISARAGGSAWRA